ncbi:MAG: histone deacetylase [Anaerolineae bacterium]|nr:histone deacetylase [Anaerolineae bacterium]
MTTTYVTHNRYRDHDMTGHNHPEHSGRIVAVWKTLKEAGLTERMDVITPTMVSDEAILRVHTQEHLDTLKWISGQEKMVMYDSDTYALPDSAEIARLSAGGVTAAIDAVSTGQADNGLAAVRPPGHHATPSRAMGFCILSNIAIGARHAQAVHGLKRVMIVDFDVHHGNGTQDVFYADDSVLFVSTHQYPFYPGTGALNDISAGRAKGRTVNIPLSAGYGDATYATVYQKVLLPIARRFQPELILVSAGFDAHHVDPLAMMRLTHEGYTHLTRELVQMAKDLCGGKIVFVMEGGYDLQALGHGMRNVAHVLLGDDEISDPYGEAPGTEPDNGKLIDDLQSIHEL